jgi:hypothetical protein
MPCPSHPRSLDHSSYIWRTVKIMKFLIMQFSPSSYHPKYVEQKLWCFEVLTAATMNDTISLDVTPSSLMEVFWRLGRTYWISKWSRQPAFSLVACLADSSAMKIRQYVPPKHRLNCYQTRRCYYILEDSSRLNLWNLFYVCDISSGFHDDPVLMWILFLHLHDLNWFRNVGVIDISTRRQAQK